MVFVYPCWVLGSSIKKQPNKDTLIVKWLLGYQAYVEVSGMEHYNVNGVWHLHPSVLGTCLHRLLSAESRVGGSVETSTF